ncbi:hypothetical protein A616_16975 [Brevibacillus brevis X23]|nr:hypothetical protein A616_16975 [Brevibacillus brevis X23]
MEHYHLFKKLKGDSWRWFDEKDSELYREVKAKYDNDNWKAIMELLVDQNMNTSNKSLITKDSYKLALKIKEDTDIEVFPAIVRIYYGSMPKMERYGWKMLHMVDGYIWNIYSSWAPRDLLTKKYEIEAISIGALEFELERVLRQDKMNI